MSNNVLGIAIIFILSLYGILGDFLIKKGSDASQLLSKEFIAGFLIFATSSFGWFYIFKHVKVSSIGVLYGTVTALGLVLIGVFLFEETISPVEIVGIIFGIISVLLLGRFI